MAMGGDALRAALRTAAWALLPLLGVGCGCEEQKPRTCFPGETRNCTGTSECRGVQSCRRDGQGFSECDCGPSVAAQRPAPQPSEPPECTPGSAQECIGAGECRGTRRCGDEGTYLACRCPVVEVPMPQPVQRPNVLGARCLTNADCGSGLFCWAESSLGLVGLEGGPAGGYCTALCLFDPDCLSFDEFSGCIHFQDNSRGICFAGCISEYPAQGEEKCLGRPELSCWSGAALFKTPTAPEVRERGLCIPHCGSDADCSAGACSGSFGASRCVGSGSVERAAIGAPCSSHDDCPGRFCHEPPGGSSFCTSTCSLGVASSCGFAPDATERTEACVLPYAWEGGSSFGPGDIGVCAALCDDDTDCASASFECRPAAFDTFGRSGACVPRVAVADAGAPDSGSL